MTTPPVSVPGSDHPTSPALAARRRLGFWSIVLLGVNGIIGAGIFLTPGEVIQDAGTLAPLAYVVAAAFAVVVGLTFATGARYVRTNGASYAYTKVGLGRRPGVYVGISHAFTAAIAWGTLASLAVTTFLQVVFPDRDWAEQTGFLSVKTLAFVVFVLLLLAVNYFGNTVVAWANGLSTVGKVLALALFVVAALVLVVSRGESHYAVAGSPQVYTGEATYSLLGFVDLGTSRSAGLVLAVIAALYAFTGFESTANAAEEMDRPDRTLPRAVPIAQGIVAVTYLLAVTAGMLLAPDAIAGSPDTVKLAAAVPDGVVHSAVVLGALVSLVGINVAASFSSPRLFTALADDGLLPRVVARRGRFGVPLVAFAVTAGFAIAVPVALGYDLSHLTGLAVISRFVQFLLVPVAVFRLARGAHEDPHAPRPDPAAVRTGRLLGTVVPVVAVLFSLFLLVSFDFRSVLTAPAGGPNLLSIALLVAAFVVVPWLSIAVDSRRRARRPEPEVLSAGRSRSGSPGPRS